jgi:hypothetical protein
MTNSTVFIQLDKVQISNGPPASFFIRLEIAGISFRTDVTQIPSLTPEFRLIKFHFRLLNRGGEKEDVEGPTKLWKGKSNLKNTDKSLPNHQDPEVIVELYSVTLQGTKLVGRSQIKLSLLKESCPPLRLLAPTAEREPIGSVQLACRVFEDTNKSLGTHKENASEDPTKGLVEEIETISLIQDEKCTLEMNIFCNIFLIPVIFSIPFPHEAPFCINMISRKKDAFIPSISFLF